MKFIRRYADISTAECHWLPASDWSTPPPPHQGEGRASFPSHNSSHNSRMLLMTYSRLEHPLRDRGGGIVYIRLCGSHFVDRTLGYIHISTLPLGGFLKNSSERHITFEIFRLSSILDFHLKRSEFSSHVWWLLAAHLLSRQPTLCSWRFHVVHWRQPIVCSWVDQFHVTHGFHCSFHLVLIICWIKHRS